MPSVASTDMYWVQKGEREANTDKDEQSSANKCLGYDIRVARLASLGLHIAKIGEGCFLHSCFYSTLFMTVLHM